MHFVSSCVSTNRGGVITLFDNSYECLESHSDPESRLSAVVIENDKLKVNVANVFCPNDYNSSLEFMGGVCDHILECIDRHPDAFVIMGGDFDACMSENDSLNRLSTRQELRLV